MNEAYDLEAEAAVLKSCLRYPDAPGDAITMGIKPAHFSERNGLIFAAILAIADTDVPLSVQTLARHLSLSGDLEKVGGQTALLDLWRMGDTGLAHYGLLVLERAALLREYQLTRAHMDALMVPGVDVSRENARFRDALLAEDSATLAGEGPISVREMIDRGGMERVESWLADPKAVRGICTGHADLDRLMGGLVSRRMTVIGASTSAGKTQWMQHMARFAAIGGVPTLLLSTEMSTDDNLFRWAFLEAGIDRLEAERHGMTEDRKRAFRNAVFTLAERPIYGWEMGGFVLPRIRVAVRRMRARHGIRLVLLDMVNGVDIPIAKGENLAQAMGRLMAGLHALAVGEDVHLMATAHINRDAMKRGEVIGLNDFRDSAAIEQWADQAVMLMPVGKDGAVITREEANINVTRDGYVRVMANLCKNRFGSLGMVTMKLDWDSGGKFVTEAAG
jgi:replicative DNA helicase